MSAQEEIRRHALAETDVMDLAAGLALNLQADMIHERNWLGREDRDAKSIHLSDLLEGHFPGITEEVRTFLIDAPNPSDHLRRAYAVIDTVDHIVGTRAHPARPSVSEPWRTLVFTLKERGRYNQNSSYGSVIPGPKTAGSDPFQRSIGRYLCFIPPMQPYRLRWVSLSNLTLRPSHDKWRIACIPTPHRADAARHEQKSGKSPPHYWIRHSYKDSEIHGLRGALREIADRKIPIVLLPELALDSDALKELVEEFQTTSASHLGTPSPLLLIAGHSSEEGSGHNRVSVFEFPGDLVWSQEKVHSYDLTSSAIRRNHLALNPSISRYHEWLNLSETPEVVIADTPFGRLMVSICEDAVHLRPSIEVANEAQVSLFILLVLDRELQSPKKWYHNQAISLATTGNITTLVVAPAWLERHIRHYSSSARGPDDSVGVIMVCSGSTKKARRQSWRPHGTRLWTSMDISKV